MFVSVDFETRGTVDLRKSGVYVYADHPDTDIWCVSYSHSDSDRVYTWCPGDTIDIGFMMYVSKGGTLRAWNSGFEYQIWNRVLAARYGWPETHVTQWVDTAAEAAAMALPRSLGAVARALGMEEQKDDEGYRLMMKMARPRTVGAYWVGRHGPYATKAEALLAKKIHSVSKKVRKDDSTLVWWDSSEMHTRLIEYCEQDVRTEKAIARKLRDLPGPERAIFLMTQRMNDRGVPVDVELVEAAKDVLDLAMDDANAELRRVTQGAVQSVTKVADLREWVCRQGVEIDNLRKDTVRDLLNQDNLSGPVREALQLRQNAGKTSTAKLDAFLRCTGADGRARGLLMYHGASTGRWAGRLVQPQNFPRPDISDIERYIPLVLARDYGALLETGHPVPVIVSSMLRSMFRAAPGTKFMAADFSQVEARVLAWLAGQDDLVELFRTGGRIYETMASYIFKLPVGEITKDSFERQIGKNSVLGAGFQMGPDRFAEQVREQTGIVLDRGDDERPDLAAQAIHGYRELYHRIPMFWEDINTAAIQATLRPGETFDVGHSPDPIRFSVRGNFLWCRLPSGRFLCYAKPELRERQLPEPYEHVTKLSLSYVGVDSLSGQWRRQYTYGGHLTENVVQAVARDLLAGAMLRVRREHYAPVLTVHDEVLVEAAPSADFNRFMELITTIPAWAEGMPLAGEGWEGERYRK